MPTDPAVVRDLLGSLLDEAVLALTTTEGAQGPPERAYVGHGQITWDCEQLTTHLLHLRPKLLETQRGNQNCALMTVATMAWTLLRCIPVPDDQGNPPSAARLDAAFRQLAIDGPAIQKHLTRAWATGAWPAGVPCQKVTWGTVEPLAPSGGYAGWRGEVAVRL